MKKLLFIIFINFLFFVFIIIFFDWIFLASENYKVGNIPQEWTLGITNRFENNIPYKKNKSTILTIGDSFIIGSNIEDNDTLSYKLQKLTGHKTYNYGMAGQGIQHVLYKLQNSPILDKIFENKQPEYIIYVFISDHIRRMYCNYLVPRDKVKYLKYMKVNSNELALIPDDIRISDYLKITHIAKRFNNFMYQLKNENDNFDFFKLYMKEIKKVMDKKYSQSKFVVIIYNANIVDTHGVKNFHTERWNELEEMGFIVINFDTEEYNYLIQNEYRASDRFHPSGKAWDKLAPIIIERLKL